MSTEISASEEPIIYTDPIKDAVSSPEFFHGAGAPPCFQYALSILSEIERLSTDENEYTIDARVSALVHALIRADDPIRTKLLLHTVNQPKHKLELFEAAIVCQNEASLEVLAEYDMGNVIESELQTSDDDEQLANLLCLKAFAGIDVYPSLEKFKSLQEMGKFPNVNQANRCFRHFFRINNLAAAKVFAYGGSAHDDITFVEALNNPEGPDMIWAEGQIKRFISGREAKKALKGFRRSSLNFKNGQWVGYFHPDIYSCSLFKNAINRIADLASMDKNLNEIYLLQATKAATAKAAHGFSSLENDIERYISIKDESNQKPTLDHMYSLACELIASRAPMTEQSSPEFTKSIASLELFFGELPMKKEYFDKLDYYTQKQLKTQFTTLINNTIAHAQRLNNSGERYRAFNYIAQLLARESPFAIDDQRKLVETRMQAIAAKLAHPLARSIVGIVEI